MKTKLKNLQDKRLIPFYIVLGYSFLSIFLSFVPHYVTILNSHRSLINLFKSFAYLEDKNDSIYYSVMMYIVYFTLNIINLLYLFKTIFIKNGKKEFFIILAILVLNIIFSSLGIYFGSKTSTNIKNDVYSLLAPLFTLIILIVFILTYINLNNNSNKNS